MSDHRVRPGAGDVCRDCRMPIARYGGQLQHRRGRRSSHWLEVRGRAVNLRGPRRALSLEEQLEVRRLVLESTTSRKRGATAAELATRYGVSIRTIWRYVSTVPTPAGTEYVGQRIRDWADDRGIDLTPDDLATLLVVVGRYRDGTFA